MDFGALRDKFPFPAIKTSLAPVARTALGNKKRGATFLSILARKLNIRNLCSPTRQRGKRNNVFHCIFMTVFKNQVRSWSDDDSKWASFKKLWQPWKVRLSLFFAFFHIFSVCSHSLLSSVVASLFIYFPPSWAFISLFFLGMLCQSVFFFFPDWRSHV